MFGELDLHVQKYETRLLPYTVFTKITMIKEVDLQPDIIQFLEINIGETLQGFDIGRNLQKRHQKQAQAIEAKINKRDYIKLRRFCTA